MSREKPANLLNGTFRTPAESLLPLEYIEIVMKGSQITKHHIYVVAKRETKRFIETHMKPI